MKKILIIQSYILGTFANTLISSSGEELKCHPKAVLVDKDGKEIECKVFDGMRVYKEDDGRYTVVDTIVDRESLKETKPPIVKERRLTFETK
ncbi:MAG: hypothetical protein PHE67_00165 [Campylobacterales bacterium]|nr:hypothetical protein [Campylobacterales bacterium]